MTEKQLVPLFRVWIKSKGCFADYIVSVIYDTLEVEICWGGINESEIFGFDDVEFLHFTGIRDKNGKEIFEGDLITETGVFNSTVKYGSWVYEEDFGAKAKSVGFYLDKSYEEHTWYENFNYDYISKNCEVVGNIYENKNMIGYGDKNE